jgi:penicillin-binding protein 1B
MKQWATKILLSLGLLVCLLSAGAAYFIYSTLKETAVDILEEKTLRTNDPYFSIFQPVILEEASIVKKEDLQTFFSFSAEKITFEEFYDQNKEDLNFSDNSDLPGLIQVDKETTFTSLMSNDCKEIYCYQHYLPFEYIPSIFWKGLIGVEDQRYLDHFGVDLKSLLRALFTNLKTMRYTQGGSTISQQLVKNLFFTSEKTFVRKIKEMIVSVYIESRFPKEKILEAYLNEVHWGSLQGIKIKGVFAASLYYFGKKPSEISPFEGAILIGLLKGPGYFHPIKNTERLMERADVVFKKLVKENFIPDDPSLIWNKKDWQKWIAKLKKAETTRYNQAVWQTLNDQDPSISMYEKYVLIQKTIDVKNKIKEKFGDKFNTSDISVKVLLGSITDNHWYTYYSRVERNKEKAINIERHQVGSTIKPIIYSTYLDLGRRMDDYVSTEPLTLKLKSGNWSPRESHKDIPEKVTMTEALLKSYNRPIVRVAEEIGFNNVEERLKFFFPALKSPLAEFPSELLGGMELSMSELKDVYSLFIRTECAKIKNSERFMDQSVLQLLSDPNQTTVERSVDVIMQKLRFFGKTGTTNNGYDNWYVAFDGKNLTLVWVGYEGQRKTKSLGLYGASTAFDVFQNYYRDRGRRFQQFGCELIN